MPTLTIEVTATQATRIQEAFASIINPETGDLPTMADMRTWLIQQIRNRVINYEFDKMRALALTQASEQVETLLGAEGWNNL